MFLREVNNNMYKVSAYFWAKVSTEMPSGIFIPILQASLIYFTIGLNQNDSTKFPIFCSVLILVYNAFSGIGYVAGTLISDPILISIINPIVIIPSMLFTGFFLKQESIPTWLIWMKETSVLKYGF